MQLFFSGKNYIILYSPDLVFLKLFGEFFRSTDKFSHLASSDKHVVAVDPDHKMLKVYSSNGENLYDTKYVSSQFVLKFMAYSTVER